MIDTTDTKASSGGASSQVAEAGAPEPKITREMVEAGGRCLRAYLPEVSFGESEALAERMLRSAFFGFCLSNKTANPPSKTFK